MRAHNAISPDVYQKRIEEKCQTLGYTFVRFLPPWKGNKTKFELMCKMHGVFQASVDNFLSLGRKCTKCTNTYRYTQEEREEQLTALCTGTIYQFIGWENRYKTHQSKAKFYCEKHGEFLTIVNDFVSRGTRCSKCVGKYKWSQEERETQLVELCAESNFSFIKWEDFYQDDHSKVVFNCQLHGNWVTSINTFIFGKSRCPRCAKYGFNRKELGTLYLLGSSCGKYLKVGISNNFSRRIKELHRATPFDFRILKRLKNDGQVVYELEGYFHKNFESAQLKGFDGSSEWLIANGKIEFLMGLLGD